MCIRHAYQCRVCQKVFVVKLRPPTWVQWVCIWKKIFYSCQPRSAFVVDEICTNGQCFRRTESGYRQCLNVPEPCYFCIRFGHEKQCGHVLLPSLCTTCIDSKQLKRSYYPRYWRRRRHCIIPPDTLFSDRAESNP